MRYTLRRDDIPNLRFGGEDLNYTPMRSKYATHPWGVALARLATSLRGAIFGGSLVRAQTRSLSIICAVVRFANCDASRDKSLPLRQKAKRQSPKRATVFLANNPNYDTNFSQWLHYQNHLSQNGHQNKNFYSMPAR